MIDRMTTYRTLFGLALALVALALSLPGDVQSQDQPIDTVSSLPGIKIETSVDRAEVFVGDRIAYTVTITYDSTFELIPPPLGANLGAFEVKDYEPDVTKKLDNGKIQSQTKFLLSTFTTGDYVIPPLPVVFRLSEQTTKAMLAEGVPVTVKSLLGDKPDSLDIKPLKSQFEFAQDVNPLLYIGAIILIQLLIAFILWRVFRPRGGTPGFVDTRDPWEIALEDLARLDQQRLIEEGQYRTFYFELGDIARAFLGRMFRVDVLEMTTSEFVAHFAAADLPGNQYSLLIGFFKHADLVKFAKYTPEPERAKDDFELVHAMISEVRDEHLRKQQAELQVRKGARRDGSDGEAAA